MVDRKVKFLSTSTVSLLALIVLFPRTTTAQDVIPGESRKPTENVPRRVISMSRSSLQKGRMCVLSDRVASTETSACTEF